MTNISFLDTVLTKLAAILPDISMSLKLGIIGGILMIVLFVVCLCISLGSKMDKYRKLLVSGSKKFATAGEITEENVDIVYDEVRKHPESISMGWSSFMEQRVGSPSDYLPAKNVLLGRSFSGKHTAGKIVMAIVGVLIWAIVGLVGYYYYGVYDSTALKTDTALAIILALEFLVIPIALYGIFLLTLDIVYGKKFRRLTLAYASFCETLDSVVVVTDRKEETFITDNLDSINRRVQELLEGRRGGSIVEVFTNPVAVEPRSIRFENVIREVSGSRPAVTGIPVVQPLPYVAPVAPVVETPVAPVVEKPVVEEPVVETPYVPVTPVEPVVPVAPVVPVVPVAPVAPANTMEDIIPVNPDRAWCESIFKIVAKALDDDSVPAEDLNTLGTLLDQAKGRVLDADLRAEFDSFLVALADKYYAMQ